MLEEMYALAPIVASLGTPGQDEWELLPCGVGLGVWTAFPAQVSLAMLKNSSQIGG